MSEDQKPPTTQPAPDDAAQPSPDTALIREHAQFKELITRLHQEGDRIFNAMHNSELADTGWADYAYTQFQVVIMAANKSLHEGLDSAKKREAIKRHINRVRAAGLN